jgi:tripartite ATP-independent transporter DctM subunit
MSNQLTNVFTKIGQAIDRISRYANYAAIFFLMIFTFSMVFEVIARKFFNAPQMWVYPLVGFSFMWFPLLACGHAFSQEKHVRCDILVDNLPSNTKELMLIIGDLVSLGLLIALLYTGAHKVLKDYLSSAVEVGIISYPRWLLFICIPIGSAICTMQVIRNICKRYYLLDKEAFIGFDNLFKTIGVPVIYIILCLFGVFLLQQNVAAGIALLTLVLIIGGTPVAFGMGTVCCLILVSLHHGGLLGLGPLTLVFSHVFGSYTLIAVPLFVWGGFILADGGLGERLYEFIGKWLSFLPGNLGAATAITGGVLAAMIGSSTAVTAIITVVAVKPLLNANYGKKLVYGTVAGTSLGIIIPPSIGLIVYGYLTDTSIGQLFMAGVIPGASLVVLFSLFIMIVCLLTGKGRTVDVTWNERFISMKRGIYITSIPILTLGGIYLGVTTPTEAAAILVILSIIGLIVYGSFNWNRFIDSATKACMTGSMILLIIYGASALAHMLAYLRIPRLLTEFVLNANQPLWVILIALLVMYLILGMFLEGASMTALTVPVIAPILPSLGIDLVSFGIMLMMMIEIALLTPPVGLNLFVVKGICEEPLSLIIKATFPFLMIILIVAVMLYFFPQLALWLPSKMMG